VGDVSQVEEECRHLRPQQAERTEIAAENRWLKTIHMSKQTQTAIYDLTDVIRPQLFNSLSRNRDPNNFLAQAVGWRRGSVVRASVFDWRTFPDLRLSMDDM